METYEGIVGLRIPRLCLLLEGTFKGGKENNIAVFQMEGRVQILL